MRDTSYIARPAWDSRLTAVHAAGRMARWRRSPVRRALMNGGELDGARILRPETVALMGENHIGAVEVQPLPTQNPQLSNDVDLLPGIVKKWGLSFLINSEAVPAGRSAGSLAWAGLNNTYFWLDPTAKVAGVFMTQILPFADPIALEAFKRFERTVYEVIGRQSPG